MISRDAQLNLVVNFTLPAIPFVPLDVNTVLIGDSNEKRNVTIYNVTSDSEVVEFSIANSKVPPGNVLVQIRIKYMGDDLHHFSNLSEPSNKEGENLCVPLYSYGLLSCFTRKTVINNCTLTTTTGLLLCSRDVLQSSLFFLELIFLENNNNIRQMIEHKVVIF